MEKNYREHIEKLSSYDLADEFCIQPYIVNDNKEFQEILLVNHFKNVEYIEHLEQQLKKKQDVIDKVNEYIRIYRNYEKIEGKKYVKGIDEIGSLSLSQVDELLDILKEME